jgi:hypothetical protein
MIAIAPAGLEFVATPPAAPGPKTRHTSSQRRRRRAAFVALYAAPNVLTRYEQEVQADGSRERGPIE